MRRKDDGKTRLARQLESLIEAGKSERDDPIFVWNFKLGVILLRFLLIILGCYLVNMKVDLARDEGPIKFMVAVSTPNAAGLLVLWFIVTVLVWILCIRMYVEAKRND